jgi:hypothetical protein
MAKDKKKRLSEQDRVDLKRAKVALEQIDDQLKDPTYKNQKELLQSQRKKWVAVKKRIVDKYNLTEEGKSNGKSGGKKK